MSTLHALTTPTNNDSAHTLPTLRYKGGPLTHRPATIADLDQLSRLESECFPPEEAATRDQILYRIKTVPPELFITTWDNDKLVGFVNGTLTNSPDLTEESMSRHESKGSTVCIHSVSVAPDLRRQGIAYTMLLNYIIGIKNVHRMRPTYKRIVLLAHDNLIPLYTKAGFKVDGPSGVHHGPLPWIQCSMMLGDGGWAHDDE
ncbi:hypothetical protein BZG36_04065 [Bifiguratus adelaidae]|uniref:N-acetyltransferase domain-containing protein n=1 Tax=Bifiguratus adelaidae TaxID=1938954 RepID=A0A261XXR1_9FUNG|nr:hypothetical protein BZG36_04065 [Bifiguratus adelaidae]